MASATLGTLKEGEKTGSAIKVIKLLAQSTGDFTRDELKKDAKLSWTDKTKAEIAAAKGDNAGANGSEGSNGSSNSSGSNSGTTGTDPETPGTGGNDNTGGGGNDIPGGFDQG